MKVVKEKKKNKLFFIFIILAIIIIVSMYMYGKSQSHQINENGYKTTKVKSTNYSENVEKAEEKSQNLADVIEEVNQSVVGISKLKNAGGSIFSNGSEENMGFGTGIIVSSKGYVLSNEHLTGERFSKCYITLDDGRNFNGSVVWSDKDLDLSITKINVNDLPVATLGDSSKIRIGENVYAIGNPIGFEFRRTVTGGIISAKNRTIKIEEDNLSYMTDLIQTDATINPGNSGGPLIYPNGEVIGINTVKISSAEGIGFAVPINVVKNIIKNFDEQGSFEEANLGIYGYDREVIPYLTENYLNFTRGIYVAQIIANGPASQTELKEGDIITAFDGFEINTMNELKEYLYTKKPGDVINLSVNRGKINKEMEIILGKK